MPYAPAALVAPGSYINGLCGGNKVVSVAGVAEKVVSSATPASVVIVQALSTNNGNVAIGGSDVKNAAGFESGIELVPGQSITIYLTDLSLAWADVEIGGEGIRYLIMR